MSNTTPRGNVLITGASTGIGRACALRLSSIGFHCFAGVRKDSDAESIEAEGNRRITAIKIDVTESHTIQAAGERIRSIVGSDGLKGLINNSGIAMVGPVEFFSMQDWRRQFEVNFFGAIAVTQMALPLLRDHVAVAGKGAARIVNISSIAGRIAQPILGPYCASKFALESLSDSLRLEVGPLGIQVSVIEPGAIDTPIWKKGEESTSAILPDHPSRKLYGALIDGVIEGARKAAASAVPVSVVTRVVEQCLIGRKPRTRYVVGRDAKIGATIKQLLPDRLFDRILRGAYTAPKRN